MALKYILPAAMVVSLSACASVDDRIDRMDNAERGATVGALGGAAAGAAIAGRGNRTEGALIGAGVGAAGGYVLGNEKDKDDARQYGYNRDISSAPFYRDENRFYDSQAGRYYYRDPATGRTYFANGEPRS